MKQTMKRILCLTILLAIVGTVIWTTVACTADREVGNNTPMANEFMTHVLADDYDAAYDLVKANVADADFRAYWVGIQEAVADAESYEMEQIGWKINTTDGETFYTTAYQVYPDNGRTVLLRVVTQKGAAGIAGIHFSDVTDFLAHAETITPVVGVILLVVSGLMLVFVIWMFVDCLRRKMKVGHKIVWAILIFAAFTLTVTVGETSAVEYRFGLMLQASSITADPGLLAFVTKLVMPLGAILYCCLRKRFTLESEAEPVRPTEKGNDR